jgi:sarcosine oxidase subunit gamma
MPDLAARSALADLHSVDNAVSFDNAGVRFKELPLQGMVRLQGPGGDPAFLQQVAKALLALPKTGETSGDDQLRCHWLTPSEWLFVMPAEGEFDVIKSLQPALAGRNALATMITDSRCAIAISGSCARELLSKGCALDLHRDKFPVGRCTITRFFAVPAMLLRVGEDRYELVVDRAQSGFVWDRLVDAAGEFA